MNAVLQGNFRQVAHDIADQREIERVKAIEENAELAKLSVDCVWLAQAEVNGIVTTIENCQLPIYAPDTLRLLQAVRSLFLRNNNQHQDYAEGVRDELGSLVRFLDEIVEPERGARA